MIRGFDSYANYLTSPMDWIKEIFESLETDHPELNDSGFAHLANVSAIELEAPFEFGSGLQVRKAQPNEVATLQKLVHIARPLTLMMPSRNPYETIMHSVETKPGSVSFETSNLPEEDWRYHVIAFEGTNEKLHDFVDASVLTRARLQLGPYVFASRFLAKPGFAGSSDLGPLWDESQRNDDLFLTLTEKHLEELKLVYQKVCAFKNDCVDIRNVVKRFKQLDNIPKNSPLRFLGYISILESMITHAPDPKDPYDSLTRQVRQKMLLIGRRCLIPVPYEVFDTGMLPDKLWTRLYEYRSKIAHGAPTDFSGRFQCLKSAETALEFISWATVAVMRQALEEPELIADLREC